MGRHDSCQFLSVQPPASGMDLELPSVFMPTRSELSSGSKLEACRDFWHMRSCPDPSQELSDYDALDPFLSDPVGAFEGPLASSAEVSRPLEHANSLADLLHPVTSTPASNCQGNEPVLEGSMARLSSGSPSLDAAGSEPLTSGGVQKARERNKRAQRTFRQRQKVRLMSAGLPVP